MEHAKCYLCGQSYTVKSALYQHMESEHKSQLSGMPPSQVYFNFKYKKTNGKCIICGNVTKWNEQTEKYERLCSELCREKYREQFKSRMIDVHGKIHLLNDPTQQRLMLESRKISGVYTSNSGYKHTYTGSYEHKFLEFLDVFMNFPPEDILSPAPQNFYYKDEEGHERFYIPDLEITSLKLLIEIKSFDNKHYRERDAHLEGLKSKAVIDAGFNHLTVPDNNFTVFINYLISERNKN